MSRFITLLLLMQLTFIFGQTNKKVAKTVKENATKNIAAVFGKSLGVDMKQEDYTSPKECFNDLISKCREANLYSQSTRASQLIRNYLVDYYPNTAISEEAKKEFDIAEEYFSKKDNTMRGGII